MNEIPKEYIKSLKTKWKERKKKAIKLGYMTTKVQAELALTELDYLEELVNSREITITILEDAVQANHEWHQQYDDIDGYPDSALEEQNTKAFAGSSFGKKSTGTKIFDIHPPAHEIYKVFRQGIGEFHATPCYGMHSPWWVPRNGFTKTESEPIPMDDDDLWIKSK